MENKVEQAAAEAPTIKPSLKNKVNTSNPNSTGSNPIINPKFNEASVNPMGFQWDLGISLD